MRKLTLSLILSISTILLPALVEAQSLRGGGGRGGSGGASLGARSFNAGNSGSGLRGGFNGRTVSNYKAFSSSNRGHRGYIRQPATRQTGFHSRFSGSNRNAFGSRSNLSGSTFGDTFSGRSRSVTNSGRYFSKSSNVIPGTHRSRSFGNHNFNQNELGGRERENFSSRGNVGSAFGRDTRRSNFTNSDEPVFRSGSNTNSAIRPVRRRHFNNVSFSRNAPVIVEEIGTAPGVISESFPKNQITHWVDKKTGVRHFSNNITSFRDGRETITFVNGKKVVSRVEKKIGSRDSINALSFRKTVTKPHLRQASYEKEVKNDIKISKRESVKKNHRHKHHGDEFDDHFHHHDDHFDDFFFINPFFSFPSSTLFFGFNPFVFKGLVLSPFAFRPFFPSALFTFHPTVSSPFLFNNFAFPSLLFPSFFNPFGFGSPFFFNQFFFAFNDFHH